MIALAFLACNAASAAEPGPKLRWWQRCETPLSPEVEKALAEMAERMAPLRQEMVAEHMQDVVKAVMAKFNLPEAAQKALQTAADKAAEETMKPWKKAVTETNRIRLTVTDTEAALEALESWNVDGIAIARLVKGCMLPDRQPLWEEALRQTLTAEQHAEWKKIADERLARREREITQTLAGWKKKAEEKAVSDMTPKLTEMAKFLKLDEMLATQFKEAAEKMIRRICEDEARHAAECMRFITDARWQSDIKDGKTFSGYILDADPSLDAEWLAMLQRLLTGAQRSEWAQHFVREKERLEKELARALAPSLEQARLRWTESMEREASKVITVLDLPAERAKALEAAAKASTGQTADIWMRLATTQLSAMDEQSRTERLSQGAYYVSMKTESQPEKQPAWKQALEKLLSAEERRRVEADGSSREERRRAALTQLVLADLDAALALTKTQREKVLPLARELAAGMESSMKEEQWGLGSNYLQEASAKVKDERWKPVLDEVQMQRLKQWQKDNGGSRRRGVDIASSMGKEPRDVEQLFSRHLHQMSIQQRKLLLAPMITRVEDAIRVLALPASTQVGLTTAAKGAVEAELVEWRRSMESYARSTTRNATAENIAVMLGGMGRISFGSSNGQTTPEQPVWKTAVETLLTPDQQTAWKAEVEAREANRLDALAGIVVMDMDRRRQLSTEQCEKLRPHLRKLLQEYLPDIGRYMNDSWYLQSYSAGMPLAGVPEKDMKAVLTARQWELFKKTDLPETSQYWESVKQWHNRRFPNGMRMIINEYE